MRLVLLHLRDRQRRVISLIVDFFFILRMPWPMRVCTGKMSTIDLPTIVARTESSFFQYHRWDRTGSHRKGQLSSE